MTNASSTSSSLSRILCVTTLSGVSSLVTNVSSIATGASFTGVRVIFMVSISSIGPPTPEFPRSFVMIMMLAPPLKFSVGVKVRPSSASSAIVCVARNVTVESSVPVPLEMLMIPSVLPKVIVPLAADTVTSIRELPASGSDIVIKFPLAALNTKGISSLDIRFPGAVFPATAITGASFCGITVMLKIWPD